MSYRLTEVAALPNSPNEWLFLVHPLTAVDIVSAVLNPYTTARYKIENLDLKQRRNEVLEQLASGELVLFDTSGASPGIFRHRRAEPETLVSNLPPQLTRALNDHWSGTAGVGISAPVQSDSLAPAIEPAYQPSPAPPRPKRDPGFRTLDLNYRWPDGTGVAEAPYVVEGLNTYKEGHLDSEGKARVTGLKDPVVNVRFGQPAPAGELNILRRQLQVQLDGILKRERDDAARRQASTDKLPLAHNVGIHIAHGFVGLWDSAVGLISNNLTLLNLTHVGYYNRALQSAWAATRDGSDQAWVDTFKQQFDEANKQALVEALGFDPDAITREQLVEAYEVASLISADPESRDMIGRFAVDFAQAQDSTEISYFAGGMVLELVLAILMGAAAGASAASAAPRYLRKLAPLATALRNLAARLKITYQTRYHYNVKTDTVCESTCRPRPDGVQVETRNFRSRRLNVTTFEGAKAALVAARHRLIARGGYTPMYTQEELLILAREGLDNDHFIVRLVEEQHLDGHRQPSGSMNGTLGRLDGQNGQVRFWSTTLDQIEASDTCPRLIAQQLGVEYNPKATYKLAIIDREKAAKVADAETIIPTFNNIKAHIRNNVDGYADKDELLDKVMTPEYQATYEKLVEGMGSAEWESVDRRNAYLVRQGLDAVQLRQFETRFNIQTNTGANQHFLGNGLTKHTELSQDGKVVHGAMETLTVEKNPQTFHAMTNGGQGGPEAYVELIDLTPIDFGD
ncbi:hypothetical protein [Marinobacter shengliensis]|uniref:hypothetical protein n=1 Tax=Marinobacter shengliensis TaxID=1389223 RepID=UPI001E635078|nr:hypothetical protein [Marinobacter shengliensis]MCD1628572.1 hypothetical protein [Marinobacter shengliensis]